MIEERDFIDFRCPHCGETGSFPQADIGFVRACPNCMEDLIVPEIGGEVGRVLPLPITTSRLVLRRFTPNDWKGLLELMPDQGEDYVSGWLERDSQVRLSTPGQTFWLA